MDQPVQIYSFRLFALLILSTVSLMMGFVLLRGVITKNNLEEELEMRASIIARRVGETVASSIWEIYQKSENRQFSKDVASAILDAEFRDPYVTAIVVYGNFGHVFMAKYRNREGEIVSHSIDLYESIVKSADKSARFAVKQGVMTTGNVRVFVSSASNASLLRKTILIEIIQTFFVSLLFVLLLYWMIRKTLILPMKSLAIASRTFESLTDGVMVTDENGVVVDVNPAFVQLTGKEQKSLVSKKVNLSITGKDRDNLNSIWTGETPHRYWNGEIALIHASQIDEIPVNLVLSPVLNEEVDTGYTVSVFQDISEQKKAQRELIHSNSELEEFAYRSSHDLRSPLVSSMGLIYLAIESFESGDYNDVKKCLTLIETSMQKLDVLIKEILLLTELNNTEKERIEFDVEHLVHEAIEHAKSYDGFDQIDFLVECSVSNVQVSKTRLFNVLDNLITNAIKYRSEQREQSYVKISISESKTGLQVIFEDNGLGIDAAHHDHVFSMFKRFHPKVAFGSGLGLYLVRKSIMKMNGNIRFQPLSSGTRFIMEIPAETL